MDTKQFPRPHPRNLLYTFGLCVFFFVALNCIKHTRSNPVFQPSFIITNGPSVTTFLLGNISDLSLSLSTVPAYSGTGLLPAPSCTAQTPTQWVLSQEILGKSVLRVQLSLNRSLQMCDNGTDCCGEPLCVLETLRLVACLGDLPQTALLIQAKIYAKVLPNSPVSENKTVIPNQVYQPLGSCPCDLTSKTCDIRCCCDKDCSAEGLRLFDSQCLPGPFGGNINLIPDYQCSVQSLENAPDWFPFLCVTSPADNNPYLGLFYQGKTVIPKPSPSFQRPKLPSPVPFSSYRQGDPLFTTDNEYFTMPQNSALGQCVLKAPVAFLENLLAACSSILQSCPPEPADLIVDVRDGLGGVVTVDVIDKEATDLFLYVKMPSGSLLSPPVLCEKVTVALNYTFYWRGNGLTGITLVRTFGNFSLTPNMSLTTRVSAVFVNGNATAQPVSGNPGYVVGRPVIGAVVDSETGRIKGAPFSMWQPGADGLCLSAGLRPVLFGVNSTSGCMLPVTLNNLTQCSQLRDTVRTVLSALNTATIIGRNGNPNFYNLADWVNISSSSQNTSSPVEFFSGLCNDVPSHLHIHIHSRVWGGQQREIISVEVTHKTTAWWINCDAAPFSPCLNPSATQSFPVTSSVTFTEMPLYSGPARTRFQINFTEYDCDRNDICWPELAFPVTRYYSGEPYSQALSKGLLLVFFFIAASILGTPWRQICQAWSSSSL